VSAQAAEAIAAPPRSWSFWRIVSRSWTLTAGVLLVGLVVGTALLAPVIAPYDPIDQNLTHLLQNPGHGHVLGTDQLGRDVLSRILVGTRTDLKIALGATGLAVLIGGSLGLLAGYIGGVFDMIVMRVVDVVMAFPFYVLIITLVFVLGSGIASIYGALVGVGWVSYARIVRGETLIARNQDYVVAARQTGLSGPRVLFRHILPNVITQPIVYAMSDIVNVVLTIVTLGFLGLGVQPPTPEWGSMIADGSAFLTTHWTLATFPAIAVIITGFGFSLLGDGIAEVIEGE
jgi:peptide/nickel transport system permease protein